MNFEFNFGANPIAPKSGASFNFGANSIAPHLEPKFNFELLFGANPIGYLCDRFKFLIYVWC